MTILAWGFLNFVGVSLISVLMMVSLGAPLIDYIKKGGLAKIDPATLGPVLAESWPAFIGILLVVILFLSVMTCGIYRLVLRPGEHGFLHLRLGIDELRLAAVNVVLLPFGLVALALVQVVGAIATTSYGVMGGVAFAALAAAPMIWIGVRLSLATPITFAEHRVAILSAWSYSKGFFWPLLGMVVLSAVFWVMVWALLLMIYFALLGVSGGPNSLIADSHGPLLLVEIVVAILTLIVQMVLPVLQWVMIYAPVAVAYQQIHGDAPANPLRVRPATG